MWSATQSVYPTRSIVAKLLGVPLDNVRVVLRSGIWMLRAQRRRYSFVRCGAVSHAVGRPVRVQLSRQDEMAWENFGSACVIDQRAGMDEKGVILAWDCESWIASRGNRPGYDQPGQRDHRHAAGLCAEEPSRVPPPSRRRLQNRSNAAPSYMAGCVDGKLWRRGTVRSERVLTHNVAPRFFTGPCARLCAYRTPSRMNVSWMRLPQREGRPGRFQAATSS